MLNPYINENRDYVEYSHLGTETQSIELQTENLKFAEL